MAFSQLHFAHPLWLWTLLAVPLVWILYYYFDRAQQPLHQLEKFIDKHLIPHLVVHSETQKASRWTRVVLWSLAWAFLAVALAGPRWNFREITTFSRDQNLVILLDLSESMNATDVAPSRLGRAKQKIEDILRLSQGVKVGLIAFAADPHMIVPMTDDKATIRHLLPSLDTDLVFVQGSKLTSALEMASMLLANTAGDNNAIVLISDGGFADASALHMAKQLAEKGIVLHSIGVGSAEGIPLKDRQGTLVKKNGTVILSKLDKEKLREISTLGQGRYFDADHAEPLAHIFGDLEKRSSVQEESHKTQRVWEEQFWLFLLPAMPFFLWWFRRGALFALLIFFWTPGNCQAAVSPYFQNQDQQAKQAFENEDYVGAAETFQDPYNKGVSYYRAGDYPAAEAQFRQSKHPEVACSAAYNLGNALAKQNRLKDAVKAYEQVLEKWPDHQHAKDNLELVKKMLEEQKKQKEQNKDKESDKSQGDQSNKNQSEQNQDQDEDEKEDKEQDQADADSTENAESTPEEPEPESEPNDAEQPEQPEQPDEDSQSEAQQPPAQGNEKSTPRSQEDLDADLWLNQIKNDPKSFLKKKFFLESKNNGTKQDIDPW